MDRILLKVSRVIPETKDTLTLLLENTDGAQVVYQAGQFLTFIFNHDGNEIRRSYSFSSTPGIDDLPAITVKRIPNGEISRFLFEHVKAGSVLNALPASGMFTIKTNPLNERQIFFVTAGSGITPVFSLLKKILAEEPRTQIVLIYQNHDENSIIFKNHLHEIAKKHAAQFKWINLLTSPKKHPHTARRLTNSLLEKLLSSHLSPAKEKLFYLCGPGALMRMSQFTLRLMGFSDEQIRKENFTIETAPPPPLITDIAPREAIIHHQKQTHAITVAYPVNILQAALQNNISIPYSCRAGRCSTCVARLMKGKVVMSINEVLTEKDMQQGLILTCVGYAETDIELEF